MGISRLYVRVQYVFVFDFAGYSLFAVGTSYMMGYQTQSISINLFIMEYQRILESLAYDAVLLVP